MAKVKTTDILALIEADHRKVEQLFEEIEKVENPNGAYEIFNQLYKELTLHTRAEELVFYPSMREYEETEEYIEEAEEEHEEVASILEEMKSLEPASSEFKSKMIELKEAVLHHVEEEESEIFAAVRESVDAQELQQLGDEFQNAKKKLEEEVEAAMSL